MNATKFDPARLPEPDSLGFFMHPDVPGEKEDDDVAALLDAMGFKFSVVSFTYDGSAKPYVSGADSTCPSTGNGSPVTTLLELSKSAGKAVGAVTTTRRRASTSVSC